MIPALSKRKSIQSLNQLPFISTHFEQYRILMSPKAYHAALMQSIQAARTRIYLVALYLENDAAGNEILDALYAAKKARPELEIAILVDWHRAQRGRIGETTKMTNARFYQQQNQKHAPIEIPFYGIPIHSREVLGVLHLKGAIIDDEVLYSGASINNVYLHFFEQYRLDRYHAIISKKLADSFVDYIKTHLLSQALVCRLDEENRPERKTLKSQIKPFRAFLSGANYAFTPDQPAENALQLTPLAGLGKLNALNKTILNLIQSAQKQIIICTPYFNFPQNVQKSLMRKLKQGCKIEIIVGDKTANDFFIPESEPFKIIGGLPYLYEMNLRKFAHKLQKYLTSGQLQIRLWKEDDHTYHLKGLWIDDEWMLITGNNLNPRGWRFDLENGILVRDPTQTLTALRAEELNVIRQKTQLITYYQQIQSERFYPKPVKKLIKRLSTIKVDALIKQLL